MAKCEYCGKRFNLNRAKEEFHDYYEAMGEDREYDDYIAHELCAECAISDCNEGMGAWEAMSEYITDD